MSLCKDKTPPRLRHKKWLTLAMMAAALLLIPRRSSPQDASAQPLNNPTDTPSTAQD